MTTEQPGASPAFSEQLGLVERLRDWADERYVMQRGELGALRNDLREAADEIERLRADVAKWRAMAETSASLMELQRRMDARAKRLGL